MKKIFTILLSVILLLGSVSSTTAYAQAAIPNNNQTKTSVSPKATITPDETTLIDSVGQEQSSEDLTNASFEFKGFSDVDKDSHFVLPMTTYTYASNSSLLAFSYNNATRTTIYGNVSSSNTNIVSVENNSIPFYSSVTKGYIYLKAKKLGSATITLKVDGKTYKARINVVPEYVILNDITQSGSTSVKLSWKKLAGCSGYYIERTAAGKNKYSIIKTITKGTTTSATVTAAWNKNYTYRVKGYVLDNENGKKYSISNPSLETFGVESFQTDKIGTKITSVTKSGSSSLKIKWTPLKEATGYILYRSTKENGVYKKVYTAKKGTISSYKQKVQKGVTYYYKLITVTAFGKSYYSPSVSQFIPKSSKAASKQIDANATGQYNQYYYEAGNKTHIVSRLSNGNLKIYTLDSKMNVKSTKTIKLGSYDTWGGFYQGTDGKFYVAVGFYNPKESKTKTVIKVYQYSSKWKKLKTASIKGSASNAFVGIYSPFSAGTCRMAMQGNTLYVHTCRLMFKHSDGLRHQSNISFAIDTRKMKATSAGDSYVSHSFDQYVKFKDGNLYLLDHGDAYPRAVHLTVANNYNTTNEEKKSYNVFKLQGEIGNNSTGCSVGGMEIGSKNILTVGAAQPHGYSVKGVKGFSNYKYNIYLTITSKTTGKTTVKWLTTYNPKTSKISLSTPRMIKLSDSRFAILYTTSNGTKSTVHYLVVDENGKKVYSKTYAGYIFGGSQQPILTDGKIVWTYYDGINLKLYSIPAKSK